jgi:hypothetical protein
MVRPRIQKIVTQEARNKDHQWPLVAQLHKGIAEGHDTSESSSLIVGIKRVRIGKGLINCRKQHTKQSFVHFARYF